MSAVDGFTWLTHPETGGSFNCPDAAVADWLANGWQPGEAPVEVNPAIAERIAFEQQQAAAAAQTKTTKPRRGESQE